MLDQLANRLMTLQIQHPVRVAIDGIDAAGKTTLADELAALLIQRGYSVIRASIDGFHRPRAERHRQGANSPEGYYADSFDYDALRNVLLEPLGPHGGRHFRRAVFDYRTDTPSMTEEERAPQTRSCCSMAYSCCVRRSTISGTTASSWKSPLRLQLSARSCEIVTYSAPPRRHECATRSDTFPVRKSI